MATYKISDLTNTNAIDDDDFLPVVDNSATQTKRVEAQVIKEYITGSVVNSLSASVLSGSDTYSTTLTASYVTGSDAKFTSLSGNLEWSYIQNTPTTTDNYGITDAVTIDDDQTISGRKTFDTHYITASITGSDAKFTTISASSITANEYNVVTINRTTLSQEGSTKFGDDDLDTHQFSGSVFVSGNVSGSDAKFTSLSGNLNWSYMQSTPTTISGYGITDAALAADVPDLSDNNTFTGTNTFNTHYITGSITGSDAKFSSITGSLQGNATSAEQIYVNDDSSTNTTRYLAFVDQNTDGNSDLRADSSLSYNPNLNRLGVGSIRLSSNGSETSPTLTVTGIGPGGSNQTGIYFVNPDVMAFTVEGSLVAKLSGSQLSASNVAGDGSELSNLSSSQITNFTNDVRAQFSAGTDIGITGGIISFTGSAGGVPGGSDFDLQFNSGSSFSGSSNLTYNYNTNTLSGTIAEFSAITSSNHNSQSPAVFVNSAGVAGSTSAFTFKTDTSVTGYLFEVRKNTQLAFNIRNDGYTYIGDTLAVRNSILLSTPTIGSANIASYRNYLKNTRFIASGSSVTPAVRIGSENNSSQEKLLSVGRNLYTTSPVDVVDVYGNGDVDVSGSLVANVRVSGSVASPIQSISYTLSSDDRGKTLLFSASTTQAITCSSGLDVGFNCTFVQMGSGQLILSGASGVDLLNRQSHTGSAGQYAAVSIVSIDNDLFIVSGDTA